MRDDSTGENFNDANSLKHAKGLVEYGWKQIKSKDEYSCQSAGVLFRSSAEILIRLRIAEAEFNERDVILWKAIADNKVVDPLKDVNLANRLEFAEKEHLISEEEYGWFCKIRDIGNVAAHEVITNDTEQASRVRGAGRDLNRLISKMGELGSPDNWRRPLNLENFYSDCLKKCLEDQERYKGFISNNKNRLAETTNAAKRAKPLKALEDDELKMSKLVDWANEYYDALSSIDPAKAQSVVREHSGFNKQGAFEPTYNSGAHRQSPSNQEYVVDRKPSGYHYRGGGALVFVAFIFLVLCFMVMSYIGI